MVLTGKQRRFLRAQAHHLTPIVTIGKEGLSDGAVSAVAGALLDHELIKVRLLEGSALPRGEAAQALAEATRAESVGVVGRVVLLYKRHPNKPTLKLPRDE